MKTLRFENAVITQFTEKTNVKAGENFAVLALTMEMSEEMADELRCTKQLYEEGGNPLKNFSGHQLNLEVWDAKISMAPDVGKVLAFDSERITKFSFSPDEEEGTIKLNLNIRITKKIGDVEAHFRNVRGTPHIIEIIPLQVQMFEEEEAEPEEDEQEDLFDEDLVPAGADRADEAPKKKTGKKK